MRNCDYVGLSTSWLGSRFSKYHVADVLPAASKGALLALVIDTDEKGLPAESPRTIVVLVALDIVL